MNRVRNQELAEYFGVSERLLPHLEGLLADFDELGSDPDLAASLLGAHGIGPGSRVLDLGCGKGAASIVLARKLGCRVAGIDAFPPFIAAAKERAAKLGLDGLCSFQAGDIRNVAGFRRNHDAVLLLAVGPVFGGPGDTIAALRRCVRPGGLMLLDDAYLVDKAVDFPGYGGLLGKDGTLAQLRAHGDAIVAERVGTLAEAQAQNKRYQSWIEERGRELARNHPDLAGDIAAYVEKERRECEIIERDIRSVVWLLRKS